MKLIEKNKAILVNSWLITSMTFVSILGTLKNEWIRFSNSKIMLLLLLLSLSVQFILSIKVSKQKWILLLFLLLVFMSFNTFINKGSLGSVVVTIASTLTFMLRKEFKFSHRQKKIVIYTSLIVFLYWSASILNGYYDYFISNRNELDLVNPNTVGMFIFYFSMLMYLVCEKYIKFKNEKIFLKIVSLSVPFILLIKLQSRSSFLALLFFILGIILKNISTFSLKSKKSIVIFTFILMIIFPFFMVSTYSNNIENENITGNIFTKKSLYSGREKIWLQYVNSVKEEPIKLILGFGSKTSHWDESEVGNMHNSFLAVLNNHGLIPYIIYIVLLYKSVYIRESEKIEIQLKNQELFFLDLLVMTSFIVISVFETNLLFSSILLQIIYITHFVDGR